MWRGVGKLGWPTSSRIAPGVMSDWLEISRIPECPDSEGARARAGRERRATGNNRSARPAKLAAVDIEVIGAGFNSAGTMTGVARAPRALRSAALIEGLRSRHRVTDSGDIRFAPPSPTRSSESGLLAEESLVSMIAGVDRAIEAAWRRRQLPLLLGGDCPVFIGALAAGRKAFGEMGLLFVDGHEDAWPPATSPTGEAADCELGLALGVTTATL